MVESGLLLPHLERILRRLESLEAPLIEVWGWPGSGKTALLGALLARHAAPSGSPGPGGAPAVLSAGPGAGGAGSSGHSGAGGATAPSPDGRRAVGLALGDLASEGRLREAVTRAEDATWLVVSGTPGERLREVARWLRPGQRLVFAGSRRLSLPGLETEVLAPQELLLTRDETGALCYLLAGRGVSDRAVGALSAATDGWLRPIRLVLEATGGVGLEKANPEDLLDVSSLRSFLRHEVFDRFSEIEREALLATPAERPLEDEAAEKRAGWHLLEEHGLWIEGPDRDRLPHLLSALLARERRRRRRSGALAVTGGKMPVEKPTFKLRLLGDPAVRRTLGGRESELGWKLRRAFHVLAFLASSPTLRAGREELVEAIWPSDGDATIERNFHPTLSNLRRTLEGEEKGRVPPPLVFQNGIYHLNPAVGWDIDTHTFRSFFEKGRAAAARHDGAAAVESWQEAWKLYRGAFLQGHYEPWVPARREAYQRMYLELLRDLGDQLMRLERPHEATDAYKSLLFEDPLQERVHVSLMRLYAAQGRRDLVRRQYERLCALLQKELSVEPLPQTVQEYHRLMA